MVPVRLLCALLLCACDGSIDTNGGNPDGGARSPDGPSSNIDAPATLDGPAPSPDAADLCAGTLLCDDFEMYPAGQQPGGPWHTSTNMGAVAIDSTRAHSGANSVHITTQAGAGTYRRAYFSIEGAPVFPVANDVFYGRMMVWLTAAPPETVHWTNIQGEGNVTGQNFRAFVRYGGQVMKQLMANYDTSGVSSDCWQHSQVAIPEGRWACMEWKFDGPANRQDFWLDGQSIPALTVNGMGQGCINNGTGGVWYGPAYDAIRLGWEHYQNTAIAIDMWIDDVALADHRIGCP
jgi:hypothetical protein